MPDGTLASGVVSRSKRVWWGAGLGTSELAIVALFAWAIAAQPARSRKPSSSAAAQQTSGGTVGAPQRSSAFIQLEVEPVRASVLEARFKERNAPTQVDARDVSVLLPASRATARGSTPTAPHVRAHRSYPNPKSALGDPAR